MIKQRTKIIKDQKGRPWLVAYELNKGACAKCCYSEWNGRYYVCHADKGMQKKYIPPCSEDGVGFLCYFRKYTEVQHA